MEKNIDQNSLLKKGNEINTSDLKESIKTEVEGTNGILKLTKSFEKSEQFDKYNLKKGEYLFKEGDTDKNIYIVTKGVLSIEKYTTTSKDSVKQLAILKKGDFLGEGSINRPDIKKEVSIKAIENTEVLSINGQLGLQKLLEENPKIGFEFLRLIISEANSRLLEANRIIATNYEIEKTINSIKEINLKTVFTLIDKIVNILGVDYILFLEKHSLLDNVLVLKYDSRIQNKLQDDIIETELSFLDLDEIKKICNIGKDDNIDINKLSIGNEVFGYLIAGRYKRLFTGSDKKVFSSSCNSFAGIINKYYSNKEKKEKLYIENMKNYDN